MTVLNLFVLLAGLLLAKFEGVIDQYQVKVPLLHLGAPIAPTAPEQHRLGILTSAGAAVAAAVAAAAVAAAAVAAAAVAAAAAAAAAEAEAISWLVISGTVR